jgi:pyruvate kinase
VKIAEEAERVRAMNPVSEVPYEHVDSVAGAVSHATVMTAHEIGAAAIIAPTVSGATAKKLSRFRPSMPVIAVTPSPLVYRQLALYWGVYTLMGERMNTTDEVIDDAVRRVHQAGYVDQGDVVVVTGGVVGGVPGATNLMSVRRISRVLVSGTGLGHRRLSGRVIRLEPGQSCTDISATMQDILVVERLDKSCSDLVYQVGGLITQETGLESYAALAAIELGIPAIIGARGYWSELVTGSLVVLDANTGSVYEGNP